MGVRNPGSISCSEINHYRELHLAVDLPEPSFHPYETRNSVEWSLSAIKLYDSKCCKFGNIHM